MSEPSRELDARVHAYYWYRKDVPIEERIETALDALVFDEDLCAIFLVPHYSTDMGAAWLLVLELRERGIDVYITAPGYDHKPERSLVDIHTREQTDGYGSIQEEYTSEHTAEHAICVAYLKVVELKETEKERDD